MRYARGSSRFDRAIGPPYYLLSGSLAQSKQEYLNPTPAGKLGRLECLLQPFL